MIRCETCEWRFSEGYGPCPSHHECSKCQQPLPVTCTRCGYSWHTKEGTMPKVCANKKCKSPYWNRKRKINSGN